MRPLALALLLAACAEGDPDVDGDGYPASVDCDDEDGDVFPDAQESCNGVDDDCDNQIDEPIAEGATQYYLDEDEDGFGTSRKDLDGDGETESTTVVTCEQPFRYVPVAGDCDDDDPKVYPGQGC